MSKLKEACATGNCQDLFEEFGNWVRHCEIYHPEEFMEAVMAVSK